MSTNGPFSESGAPEEPAAVSRACKVGDTEDEAATIEEGIETADPGLAASGNDTPIESADEDLQPGASASAGTAKAGGFRSWLGGKAAQDAQGGPAAASADLSADLKAKEMTIQALVMERDQYKDLLLRAQADYQNLRRRAQQEKDELRKYANENLVTELLPILDNFERTLVAAEQGASIDSLTEGIKAVDRQMRTVLEQVQLRRVAAVGSEFDPVKHEAIGTQESEDHEEGTIIVEVMPGYSLAEKVIRPARVLVARKP